jgi:hypothetical protein
MDVLNAKQHHVGRVGWLRATVLGADDGVLSTSSLLLGVAASHATHSSVMVAGIAGMVAGAMSMAAGEYVSVSSQADSEKADIERERAEIKADDAGEHAELTSIYVARGLEPALAKQVAKQLMVHDPLGAHARDELGISETLRARPISGRLGLRRKFRRWRGNAAPRHRIGTSRPFDSLGCCIFADIPRAAGRPGRSSGRLRGGSRCSQGYVLGRVGHGAHRRNRVNVRSDRVSQGRAPSFRGGTGISGIRYYEGAVSLH